MESDKKSVSLATLEGVFDSADRFNKRLINLLILVLVLWAITIAAFLWYISLPSEEVNATQTMEDVDNSTQVIGDDYGQSDTN